MKPPRESMALVAFLWIAFAINYLDRQMAYSIFPALRSDLGFTTLQISLIGTVFMWTYTLAMPFAGWLADRWRQDRMILASLVLWSLATLASALSRTPAEFLFLRGAIGIAESLYYPAALTLLAGVYSEGARSRALGIHQSAQLAGVAAGGWYGGWAADTIGWRPGFSIAALAGLAYALVLWRVLARVPVPNAAPAARPGPRANPLGVFRSFCYVALAATFALFCAMLWVFYAWLPAFLTERYQLSMTEAGWNATVFVQTATGIGIVSGGALADRFSARHPRARFVIAAAGVILSAPFGYLTFAATSLAWMRVFSIGFGLFSGLMMANAFAAAYGVIQRRNWGAGGGILNMIGGIASAIMIFSAGMLKETIGFAALMGYVMTAAILCALVLLAVVHRRFGPERRKAAEDLT